MSTKTASALSLLARLRRAARRASHERDMFYLRANTARRELAFVEQHMPAQAAPLASLEWQRQATDHECRAATALMAELGETIARAAGSIDVTTTIEQRCDILNVNRTHRTFSGRSPGLLTLVLDLDLEDSALTVGHSEKSGPMFQCLMKYIVRSAPSYEDALRLYSNEQPGHIFHPEGPFFGITDYVRDEDGTVRYSPAERLVRAGSHHFNVNLMPLSGTLH